MFFFSFSRRPLLWNPEGYLCDTFSLLPGIMTVKVSYVSWVWCETAVWPTVSGFGTITVNVTVFAHWKKKGAADLTKQTWTTAGLTAVYQANLDFFFSPMLYWKCNFGHRSCWKELFQLQKSLHEFNHQQKRFHASKGSQLVAVLFHELKPVLLNKPGRVWAQQ